MTTIVQLQDEHTGNNIAPITHWDAVSNKPDVALEDTLVSGITAIEEQIAEHDENISSALTNSTNAILSAVTNIDLSYVAKEETLLSGISMVSQDIVSAVETIKDGLQGPNSAVTLSYLFDQIGDLSTLLDEINGETMPIEFATDYARQGDNSAVTLTSIDEKLDTQGGGSIPMVMVTNDVLAQELLPNTCYMFANRTNDLTITLGTPLDSGISEYHMFLYIGDTVPTVTFPQDVDFGGTFTIPSDKTNSCIEISILNNMGICTIW